MTTLAKTEAIVTVTVQDIAKKFDAEGKEQEEWTVLFPWSKFPQRMMLWNAPAVMPAKNDRVTIAVKRGGRRGNGDGSSERDYWWNFNGFPDAQKPPPAGVPAETEPFPVAGATRERPQSHPTAPVAHSAPQEPAKPSQSQIDPSTVAVRTYSYSRTYNLGNFESERFELDAQMPPGWSDAEAFAHLRERIEQVRAALPAGVDARAAAKEHTVP